MRNNTWTAFLLTILLVGCTVGPKYEPPVMDVPCQWNGETNEELQTDSPDGFLWWEALNDPLLNSLIERAVSQNLDLTIAAMRVLEARAEHKGGSSSFLYPHIDASAAYGCSQYNKRTLNKLLGTHGGSGRQTANFFEVGFDAEWELDLFGMNRHEICALKAKMEASEEEFCHIEITLLAEVARNYIELRGLQQRLDVIVKNINTHKDTLQLTQDLTTSGFASSVDQKQAEEQLHLLAAEKPQIENSIHKTIHRLSILLGYAPGELFEELNMPSPLPCMPCQKPIGVPSELLRRRPDIRKAERDLAAATERVGTAIASLFPRLSLRGFIGDIGALSSNSFTWFAGPQLLAPIFNSKLIEQDIQINKIRTQQALYQYQKTVLEALEEAENAISAFHYEREKNSRLAEAQKASKETYELILQLYQKGFKGYLDVLVADRSFLAAQDAYLQSQVDLLFHYIALYKALGGGWNIID